MVAGTRSLANGPPDRAGVQVAAARCREHARCREPGYVALEDPAPRLESEACKGQDREPVYERSSPAREDSEPAAADELAGGTHQVRDRHSSVGHRQQRALKAPSAPAD